MQERFVSRLLKDGSVNYKLGNGMSIGESTICMNNNSQISCNMKNFRKYKVAHEITEILSSNKSSTCAMYPF